MLDSANNFFPFMMGLRNIEGLSFEKKRIEAEADLYVFPELHCKTERKFALLLHDPPPLASHRLNQYQSSQEEGDIIGLCRGWSEDRRLIADALGDSQSHCGDIFC